MVKPFFASGRWVRAVLNRLDAQRYRRAHTSSAAVKDALTDGSKGTRFPVAVAYSAVMAMLFFTPAAQARPPVPPNVYRAVRHYWHTKTERIQAFNIVACETGGAYNTNATNGQYLGLFQMGSYARARYGHGSSADAQARAAHRYWLDSGWSPWSCRP